MPWQRQTVLFDRVVGWIKDTCVGPGSGRAKKRGTASHAHVSIGQIWRDLRAGPETLSPDHDKRHELL